NRLNTDLTDEQSIFLIDTAARTTSVLGGELPGVVPKSREVRITKNGTAVLFSSFEDNISSEPVKSKNIFYRPISPSSDFDDDGVLDSFDNCPNTPNLDQADDDGFGPGNACDRDFFRAISSTEDLNGNGSRDVIVASRDLLRPDGRFNRVCVYDGYTGALLKSYDYFGVENRRPDGLLTLSDASVDPRVAMTSRGFSGVSIAEENASSFPNVQIRNPITGSPLGNLFPWNANWNVINTRVLNHGIEPTSLLTLAVQKNSGQMSIERRDVETNVLISRQYPLGFAWKPLDFDVLQSNGQSATAGLATRRSDALTIVQVRNVSDSSLIRNVFPLGLGWTPLSFRILPDLNSSQTDEVAVMMRRDTDGLLIIQIRDAASNDLIKNVYPIGAGLSQWQIRQFEPITIEGIMRLAVVATHEATGQILVQTKDPMTDEIINNNFFIGPPWEFRESALVIPEYNGNNSDEIAIPVRNSKTGERLIQIRDGDNGELILNLRTSH
ncbi:MAG: thrombospondin type 3 repeat-containing protein, partial [Pseudomonadota bacterium]